MSKSSSKQDQGDEQQPAVETIQGGDIHENPPEGALNPPSAGPVIVHRALTKSNLMHHSAAIARAVSVVESELAKIQDKDNKDPEKPEGMDDAEWQARIQQAALFVGNPVLVKPEGDDFRTQVTWAIARALRPKLVTRHRGVTPEVEG